LTSNEIYGILDTGRKKNKKKEKNKKTNICSIKKIKQKKEKTNTIANTKKMSKFWGAPPPPESSASNSDGVPIGDHLCL